MFTMFTMFTIVGIVGIVGTEECSVTLWPVIEQK